LAALAGANNSELGLIAFGWIGAIIFLIPTLDTDKGDLFIQGKGDPVPWKAAIDIVLVSIATIVGAAADYKEPGQAAYIPIATIIFVLFAVLLGLFLKFVIENA
jgi:hypothetical protein